MNHYSFYRYLPNTYPILSTEPATEGASVKSTKHPPPPSPGGPLWAQTVNQKCGRAGRLHFIQCAEAGESRGHPEQGGLREIGGSGRWGAQRLKWKQVCPWNSAEAGAGVGVHRARGLALLQ